MCGARRRAPVLARSRRSSAALAGYHPSRRPVGTTYDCAPIRRKTAPTKPKWMSGSRDARREPQGRARYPGRQSCLGRLPLPPENAKIAFRWGWHKLEMPQPLRRPAQTRQAPPAPASSIDAARRWLGTTPPEGRSERYMTAPRSVQRLPRLAENRYQDSAYLAVAPRLAGAHRPPDPLAGPVAASKMRLSRSSHNGTNLRCPVP